MELKFSKISV